MKVIWPLEVEGPKNQTVYEGDNVTLSCRVTNDPRAQIQWLRRKQGSKLNSSVLTTEEQMFMPKKANAELLILHNVTVNDAGLYKCLAGNFDGLKYSDAWLTVLPRGSQTKPPATTEYPQKKTTSSPMTKPTQEVTTQSTRAETMGPKIVFTKPTKKPTKRPRKNGSKDRKFPMITERPRNRKPKPTPRMKDKGDGPRSKGNRRKNTPFYPMFTTMAPKSRTPKRTEIIEAKNKDPIFVAPNADNPGVYNSNPPEKEENSADNSTNMKDSLGGTEGHDDTVRVSSIDLWKVYIIVGAIGGGILLIGLVTLVVAVACGRREEGQYKSTTV